MNKRITFRSCLLAVLATGVLVIGMAFAIQPFVTPDVDPNLKAPEAIELKGEPAELANLPEHSITRGITQRIIDDAKHPLIPLLAVAQLGIDAIENDVQDYTATIVSQVRVHGKLGEERYMFCKLRHEKETDRGTIPLSIYTRFLKPKSLAGQEAIWVDGLNKGKIIAHAAGLKNVKKFYLNPQGPFAMNGNRYPIWHLGMKNLIKMIIEKGEKDLDHGECVATVKRGIMIDGHKCTLMEIVHPEKRDHFEFHMARIYIDDERNLPIAYEGYLWPETEGGEPLLLEKYYYTDIKLNPGLRRMDFSSKNSEYNFTRW